MSMVWPGPCLIEQRKPCKVEEGVETLGQLILHLASYLSSASKQASIPVPEELYTS